MIIEKIVWLHDNKSQLLSSWESDVVLQSFDWVTFGALRIDKLFSGNDCFPKKNLNGNFRDEHNTISDEGTKVYSSVDAMIMIRYNNARNRSKLANRIKVVSHGAWAR